MRTAVALFTRDLRVADNPMLRAALDQAEVVLPLFVRDDGIAATRFGSSCMRIRSRCSIAREPSSSSVVAWKGERYG